MGAYNDECERQVIGVTSPRGSQECKYVGLFIFVTAVWGYFPYHVRAKPKGGLVYRAITAISANPLYLVRFTMYKSVRI